MSSTGALDVAVEVAMIFQLRPTTTGASLRWHRDVSWVCGGCTATPGASRRRKTQVPARVLCLSGSCRLSHAEKHGSQRAKGAAVPARAGQMRLSHAGDIGRATSAYRRTRHRAASTARWAHFRHRPASLAFLSPLHQRDPLFPLDLNWLEKRTSIACACACVRKRSRVLGKLARAPCGNRGRGGAAV